MAHNCTLKKILAALLCLCLLLGSVGVLAEDVANVSDKRGPNLYNFKFAQNKQTLEPGSVLNLSVCARDRSGIKSVYAQFYRVVKDINWWEFDAIELKYNEEKDLFTADFVIPKDADSGTYRLSRIWSSDQYGNTSEFWAENNSYSLGKFTLKSKIKAKVKINKNKKTVKPADKMKFTGELTNAPEGTKHAYVILTNKEYGWTDSFPCKYDETTGKFEGESSFGWTNEEGKIVCNVPNGKWELTGVRLSDEDYEDLGTADASGQYVNLTGSDYEQNHESEDSDGPTISSVKFNKKGKTLKTGDTIRVEVKVKDKSGVRSVYAYFYPMDGRGRWDEKTKINKSDNPQTLQIEMVKKSGNKYVGEYTLTEKNVNTTYALQVEASDERYNWSYKWFDNLNFTFADKDYVTTGINEFVNEVVMAITGSAATDAQINDLGMQLAEGKATGVEIVKKVVESTTLSKEEKANKLALFMRGTEATAEEQAMDIEPLIDKLAANAQFRKLCNDSNILAGSFSKTSDGLEIGISKPIKKIKLNKKKLSLKVKKSEWLSTTVKPKDATAAWDFEWTSSDESVAKVSEWGEVTGVGAGECTITCKATDGSGVTAECKVTVKGKSKNSKNELKLAEPVEKVKLKVGESQRITLTNADMKVKWSSSDKSVAKGTSSGKIKAVGKGKCTITCEAEDGSKIEIPVKVK